MSNEGLSGGAGGGQYAAYTPPPPASRTSPWLYVGLGCGLFILLAFGGCAGALYFGANKLKGAMNGPLDKAALAKELSDVPIYPNAKLDEKTTKIFQASMGIAKSFMKSGQSMTMAAYISPDDDSQILQWYDKNMASAGYKQNGARESGSSGSVSHTFSKGNVIVSIQIPSSKSQDSFHIMRMQGMDKSEAEKMQPASNSSSGD